MHSRKFIDLTGQIVGRITVLQYLGHQFWECRCACGKVAKIRGGELRKGGDKTCGEAKCRFRHDLEGRVFGKLTVLHRSNPGSTGEAKWLCRCTCGGLREVATGGLRSGPTRSCEKIECRSGVPKGGASFHRLLRGYQDSAKRRGVTWGLSEVRFQELTRQSCHYCGTAPSQVIGQKNCNGLYLYNGVDRVSSEEGYVEGNVVPCCKACNQAKGKYTQAEFETWLDRVVEFRTRNDR